MHIVNLGIEVNSVYVVNAIYTHIKIVLLQNVFCTLIRVELLVWTKMLLKREANVLVSRHSVFNVRSVNNAQLLPSS